jgi:hypothetical protein
MGHRSEIPQNYNSNGHQERTSWFHQENQDKMGFQSKGSMKLETYGRERKACRWRMGADASICDDESNKRK